MRSEEHGPYNDLEYAKGSPRMTHFTQSELSPYGDPVIVPEWAPAPAMLPARFTEISVPQVQPLQFAEKLMDVIAPEYVEDDFVTVP